MTTGHEDGGIDAGIRDEIRRIVADIVEVDVEEIGWNSHFWDELKADSLQGIEILSALERRFRITIEQSALAVMHDVQNTYEVVVAALAAARAGAR
ncbi:polyketide-8 synthase acyl carrier protein [Amycolatopsis sp. AA4]|uniref:acyl carrier protein n=1 Tax=Actinomycetes TaxID=1760 RepID=UPI0001B57079|nr:MULTISPECIES: phosphopantetheine-binding protein [Actinomycetes]ATY12789.1 polyketide-8 synthase acyl carrier protein [Amycolatopsis sp. AA4]EFL08609.1 acyl carrier protein [Streptomyces sp. AA4]